MRVLLLAFTIISLCFLIFSYTRWIWSMIRARRNGMYPPKGAATMFDVRRFLLKGEKELAVRLYCEIFQTNQKTARKAVEELERSIQGKNSGFE